MIKMLMNMNTGRVVVPKINLIPTSIDANGNIVGLIENKRYNSGDNLVDGTGYIACGFIPYEFGETLHFENISFGEYADGACYLRWYLSMTGSAIYSVSPYTLSTQSSHPAEITALGVTFHFTYDDSGNMITMMCEKLPAYAKTDDIHYIRMAWALHNNVSGTEKIWKE